jgi:hypothetical protein
MNPETIARYHPAARKAFQESADEIYILSGGFVVSFKWLVEELITESEHELVQMTSIS